MLRAGEDNNMTSALLNCFTAEPVHNTDMSPSPTTHNCPRSWLGEHHERHERRTRAVVGLTLVMMVAEIIGGHWFGSMALVADGWHMATHAAALTIAALAYRYARAHARDPRFAFGTGKVGDLAGFASAVSLAIVALLIGAESLQRLVKPQGIDFVQAGGIAVLGLIVNLLSAWMLHDDHPHHDDEEDDHDHDDHPAHHDNNLRAAYLHVLADALTSVLAIAGLLAGYFLGWVWMDAVVGLLGAAVIAHWSIGLARSAGRTLLDSHDDSRLELRVRECLHAASSGAAVTDLHLWRLGPGRYGLMVSLRGAQLATPDQFRSALTAVPELAHITVETNPA
jgi:cation diffusion facilitator family transporter